MTRGLDHGWTPAPTPAPAGAAPGANAPALGPADALALPFPSSLADVLTARPRRSYRELAEEERRSARLLFAAELAAGLIGADDLGHPAVHAAVAARRVPHPLVRAGQRALMKHGVLGARDALEPLQAARRAVLGSVAERPPRFLVRMDEYPHVRALDDPEGHGDEAFSPWREVMAAAGCAHLVAVLPVVPSRAQDPSATGARAIGEREAARLRQLAGDGVAFAVHGLDHRTRDARPARHSELCGLAPAALEERLDRAEAVLAERAGLRPRVFVPPFNRFDAAQYAVLARRYEVVCGGPESVPLLGFHPGPLWMGEAVYVPAYEPLYGTAAEILPVARELIETGAGVWIPVVLHWSWEAADGWEDLRRLAELLAPHAAPWPEFLEAVAASRAGAAAD